MKAGVIRISTAISVSADDAHYLGLLPKRERIVEKVNLQQRSSSGLSTVAPV